MSIRKRHGVALLAWVLVAALLWQIPVGAEPALAENGLDSSVTSPETDDPLSESDEAEPEADDADDNDLAATDERHGALAGDSQQGSDATQTTVADYVDDAIGRMINVNPSLASLVTSSLAEQTDLVTKSDDDEIFVEYSSPSGASIELPALNTRHISMENTNGLRLLVGLPGDEQAAVLSSSGRTVYSTAHPATHLAIDILDDATARALAVIDGPDGAAQLRYSIGANVEFDLIERDDGGIDIRSANGITFAHIDAPWAFDADGAAVPTKYSIDGHELLLEVSHGPESEYPIIADPRLRWGIITGTIYLSKSETDQFAAGAISIFTVLAGIPSGVSQAVAAYSGYLATWAASATSQNKCLKIKIGATWSWRGLVPGVEPGHYVYEAGIRCR